MCRFCVAGTHSSRNLPDAGASSSQRTMMHMMVTSKGPVPTVNSRGRWPRFMYLLVGDLGSRS